MSTQYDDIVGKYDAINDSPITTAQVRCMKKSLAPISPSAKVLELACGSGYYTQKFLSWGASHITGIDISSGMLDSARASLPSEMMERVDLHVGNCTDPDMLVKAGLEEQQGTYDLVVASWLLNYAGTKEEMRYMFSNISAALKPGGRLVALTINPKTVDMFKLDDEMNKEEEHYGYVHEMIERMDEGWRFKIKGVGGADYEFETFYFKEEMFAEGAREAGMGELKWEVGMPDEELVRELVS